MQGQSFSTLTQVVYKLFGITCFALQKQVEDFDNINFHIHQLERAESHRRSVATERKGGKATKTNDIFSRVALEKQFSSEAINRASGSLTVTVINPSDESVGLDDKVMLLATEAHDAMQVFAPCMCRMFMTECTQRWKT